MSNLILKVFLFAGLDEVSTKFQKIKGLSSFTDIRCRVGELMTGKRGYKQTFFWFVCRWIYKRGTLSAESIQETNCEIEWFVKSKIREN